MSPVNILLLYLLIINLLTFLFFGIDKKRAERKKWRIPEGRLLLLSALGGAFLDLFAMAFFRHKTRALRFLTLLPLFLLLQGILLWYLLPWLNR